MHIVHIAAEVAPIAKVGGLGDVLLGLPSEQSRLGHNVDLFLPKYDCLDTAPLRDLHFEDHALSIEWDGEETSFAVWVGWLDSIKIYFIDQQQDKLFYSRGCIYGCEDDMERFLFFAKAALETMKQLKLRPDVFHLHDWHTAIAAPLIKDFYPDLTPAVAYTIHNLQYQGLTSEEPLEKLGFALDTQKIVDPHNPKLCNLMKAGIVYADSVTTVSKTYAEEIQTEEYGNGLAKLLSAHGHKVEGIVNGVDYSYWDPEKDPYLPAHFSSRTEPATEQDSATIDRKGYVKKRLRERLSLDEAHRPIVGVVSRLVPQKGVELIKHALYRTLELGGQFVLLGSSPIASINREFHDLMHAYADHPHVRLTLKHEEQLAHLIFGGADLLIVPSIFEPCGLTQLIAMRYGALPVVRRTGGLADTVVDIDTSAAGNGFLFDKATIEDFDGAFERAITLWKEEPARFRSLQQRVMQIDYSWKKPAQKYLELYEKLIVVD